MFDDKMKEKIVPKRRILQKQAGCKKVLLWYKLEKDKKNANKSGSRNVRSVEIGARDINTLNKGEWLNDEVINFWMIYLQNDRLNRTVEYMTTFFYTSMLSQSVEAVDGYMNADVINKKMIFIPINQEHSHWSLLVVMNASKIEDGIKYANGNNAEKNKMKHKECPVIVALDSLNTSFCRKSARLVRQWLELKYGQLKKKKGTGNEKNKKFSAKSIPLITPNIPGQGDFVNCGVYCCMYMKCLHECFGNFKITFGELNEKRYNNIEEVVNFDNPKDIKDLRKEMKNTINKLSK